MITRQAQLPNLVQAYPQSGRLQPMGIRARWEMEGGNMDYQDGIQLIKRIDESIRVTCPSAGKDDANSTQVRPLTDSWLRLLCFAYARGILESQDICELSHDQPWILGPSPSRTPSPASVMRFRRENRERIENVLALVLNPVVDTRHQNHLFGSSSPAEAMVRARNLLNVARHLDSSE